jgi:FemAB-related protein (PEP-CTERM system-associated)
MTMALNIRPATDKDHPAWSALLMDRSDSTFFQRPEWPGLLERTLGFRDQTLLVEDDRGPLGLLPLSEVRSALFGNALCSLPFCAYAGPLIRPEREEAVIAALTHGVRDLARSRQVGRVELRSQRVWDAEVPRQSLYVTFIGPLPKGLDDLSGVPQKRRNVIRRAQSMGLGAQVHRDADRFFELYAENCRSHGTPGLGKSFFRELLRCFPESDLDILSVVDAQGRDISAILNFYHQQTVMAYFAGENALARQCNGNDYKYWALMRHARDRGCHSFDFGRSKQGTGSFTFKKLWGFQAQALHYEFPYLPSGRVPQNNPSNPKFDLAMKIWQKLPRLFTDHAGPMVARGLG